MLREKSVHLVVSLLGMVEAIFAVTPSETINRRKYPSASRNIVRYASTGFRLVWFSHVLEQCFFTKFRFPLSQVITN
ncbi:hypothetical protein F5050DRAFT_1791105 [Lentinula boryana]|uniref:Secreted protein n=1 Tax=Lentinula boryana TaxID=40481 RepID=A0ABQ8Q2Q6_9AGAR|nr:hypothetical protein F5050DRAFT_1791105 [Lentinula boryana]